MFNPFQLSSTLLQKQPQSRSLDQVVGSVAPWSPRTVEVHKNKVQCLEHQSTKTIHDGPSYLPSWWILAYLCQEIARAPRPYMTRCMLLPSSPAEKRISARESKIGFGTLKHTSGQQSCTDTGFVRSDNSVSMCFMPQIFQQHVLSSGEYSLPISMSRWSTLMWNKPQQQQLSDRGTFSLAN